MKKKLIFIDVDGTLLDKSIDLAATSEIHLKNIEIIKRLVSDGHIVILMAGRPYRLTKEIYELLNLKHMNVNLSGSHINNPSDDDFHNLYSPMNKDKVINLLNEINNSLINLIIESPKITYLHSKFHNDWYNLISKRDGIEEFEYKGNLNFDPYWIYLEVNLSLKDELDILIEKYKNIFNFKIWWIDENIKLEIGQSKMNKGEAAKYIAKYYNININDAIGIADNVNDIELLKTVGIPIAMANAHESVKQISKYITKKDNSEGGVGYFLEELFYN